MANVLSKLYEHLCGLTFPRWVSSTGPGPARCPVCGKAILNRRQVAPSSSQPRALKRRCPLPEGPTPGDDPSGSPEHSRKRPSLMLPPGDSGLEFARSPSTPSCQLGSSLQISTPKTPAQLEERKSPYDVPLPDPRGTEVKGLEDPDGELKILEAHKGEAQGRGPPSHGAMALGSWVTIRRDFTLSGHCPSPHQGIVPNVERDEKVLVSPVGTPSHGCDIPTSQSSIVDTLDNNELQNGSHSQESGEVVEGQKPTASPPPDSQESGEVVEDQNSTASPPPDSQESGEVVEDQKSTASPPPDSQESGEVVEGQKPTASPPPDSQKSGEVVEGHKPTASPPTDSQKSGEVVEGHKPTASPPPDSQESAKGVAGEKPKDLPHPDSQESMNMVDYKRHRASRPPRASKRKATLPSVLPLPQIQPVPIQWGRTELPLPPKLPCVVMGNDLDICKTIQHTKSNDCEKKGSGKRTEVTSGSVLHTASSVPQPEAGACVLLPLPTCTSKIPALPNTTNVEEQAAVTNTVSAPSSNAKEGRTPKFLSSPLARTADLLPSGTTASNFAVLQNKDEGYDHLIRNANPSNSLSQSTPLDHHPFPCKNESPTPMCVDSPPLSFPTLPVVPPPNNLNSTSNDLTTLTPSISSHLTTKPDTDDIVHMDTTPPSEAIIFTSPTVSSSDTCAFTQVPDGQQQGNFLNGTVPINPPGPPPNPLSQVPGSLQQGPLMNGLATSPPIPHHYPFPQVLGNLHQGSVTMGPVPSNPLASYPLSLPQGPCSLSQGHHPLNGQVPSSAPIPNPCPDPQIGCGMSQGQLIMGPDPTSLLTPYTYPVLQMPYSLHQGQHGMGLAPTNPPPPRMYCPSQPVVPQNLHGDNNAISSVQQQHAVPPSGTTSSIPDSTIPPLPYTNPVSQMPYSLHQGQLGMGPAPTNPPPPRTSCPSQPLVPQNHHGDTNAIPAVQQQHTVPPTGTILSIPDAQNQFFQSQPIQGPGPTNGHRPSASTLLNPTVGVFNGQYDNTFSQSLPAALPTPAGGLPSLPMQLTNDSIVQSGHMGMTALSSSVYPPRVPNPPQALVPQNDTQTNNVIPAGQPQHSASVPTCNASSILPNVGQAMAPIPGSGDSPPNKPSMDDDINMDTTPPSEVSILPSLPVLTNNQPALNQAPPAPSHMPQSGTTSSLKDSNNQFTQAQATQGASLNSGHPSNTGALPQPKLGIYSGQPDINFSLSQPAALPTTAVAVTAPPTQLDDDDDVIMVPVTMEISVSQMLSSQTSYTSQSLIPQNDPWNTNVIPVVQQQHSASVSTCTAPSVLPNMGQAIAPLLGSGASPAAKPSTDDGNQIDKKSPSGVSHYPSPPVLTNNYSVLNPAPPPPGHVPQGGTISSMQDSSNQFLQSQPGQGPSPNTDQQCSTVPLPYPTPGVVDGQSDNFSLSYPAALPIPAVGLTAPPMQPPNDSIMQSGHMTMTVPLSGVNPHGVPNPSQALVSQNDPGTTNVIPVSQQPYSASVSTHTTALLLPNTGPAIGPISGREAFPQTQPSMDNNNMMYTMPPLEASVFPSPPMMTNNHSALIQAPPASDHVPHSGTTSSMQDSNNQFSQSQTMQGPSPNTGHQSSTGVHPHPTLGVFNGQSDNFLNRQSDNNFSPSYQISLPTPAVGLTVPAMQSPNDTIMQSGQGAMTMVPGPAVNSAITPQQAFCSNSNGVFCTATPPTSSIKTTRRKGSGETNSSLNQAHSAKSPRTGNGDALNARQMGFQTATKCMRYKAKAYKGCRRQR